LRKFQVKSVCGVKLIIPKLFLEDFNLAAFEPSRDLAKIFCAQLLKLSA
jgi:hypothetical protein